VAGNGRAASLPLRCSLSRSLPNRRAMISRGAAVKWRTIWGGEGARPLFNGWLLMQSAGIPGSRSDGRRFDKIDPKDLRYGKEDGLSESSTAGRASDARRVLGLKARRAAVRE